MDVASLPISPLLIFPLMVLGTVVVMLGMAHVCNHMNRMIHRHGGEWAVLYGVVVVLCAVCIWAVVQ
jgi:fumarate reductase subunit D